MSSKVTYKVGGKEVHPSQLGDRMKEAAVEAVKDSLREKIEAVRCPVHNQNAKAVLKETTGGKLNYDIQGCCEVLIEEVKKSLGAQ
ncbi:MAG: hypothetical protein WBE13_17135 [Candidatus Acidiferrum sp.]